MCSLLRGGRTGGSCVFCFSCDSPAPVILRTLLTLMDLSTGEPRAPLRAHGHAPSPEATSHQPPTTYPPHPPSAWLDATKWPSLRPWIRNSMLHRLKGRLCSPRSTQIHNYRVLARSGYSISLMRSVSPSTQGDLWCSLPYTMRRDCDRQSGGGWREGWGVGCCQPSS